ncbi:MAG: flagellar export protein FliJ [Rubrivivax sp.]
MSSAASIVSLQVVLDRATQERDRLAAELRRAEELALRARRQGEQLAAYRGEYLQRWSRQFGGRGGAIEIVHCYQSFMQRLDEALQHQQRQVQAAERGQAAARQALLQAETRLAGIRKLIERRQAEIARAHERRDQRQTDETAQGLLLRRRRAAPALQH